MIHVHGMLGLGDNLYQRPFVRAAALRGQVYLSTPWPELYDDLGVRFVRADTSLRAQRKNLERQPAERWSVPPRCSSVRITYLGLEGSISEAMERAIPLGGPLEMDLPPLPASPVSGRYAVVRPVTTRTEWRNPARNPIATYVREAARALQEAGFRVVSLADLCEGREWIEGPPISADVRFDRGELPVELMLALIQGASVVVGGPGFIVPAALAARTPLIVIAGGQGALNGPQRLVDRRIDASRVRWLLPEPYCMCADRIHTCPKEIPDFSAQVRQAIEEIVE